MQADSLLPDPPGRSACNAEHMGLIPALGIHCNGKNPLQYS